ncbi:MAG: FAD-dependent oxidoreductase [Coriobacteriales bacterium]|nr:FAD-dependent oxidoreductase [Coriobacteriales bacterium]
MADLYDLIIVGAGSSGMSAALYAGRAKLKTLVLDRDRVGGQIKITNDIENYPGIPQTSGEVLSQTLRKQAENFGATFIRGIVEKVDFTGDIKRVCTVDGCYDTLSVILATGSVPRTAGFKGEEEFRGHGIGYCATCDGEFFSDMDVFVVGGGLAAAEEALFLTRYARKVTLIVRGDKLKVPHRIAEKVFAHSRVEVHFNSELIEVTGDSMPRSALFINNSTGETWRYDVSSPDETFGIFVFAGYLPQSSEYIGAVRIDDHGYITTDEGMRTNIDGVYAAGDVRPKELRQLVTAVADGAIAATNAEKYVELMRTRLSLPELGAERDETGEICASDATPSPEATATSSTATAKAISSATTTKTTVAASPTFFDDAFIEQLAPVLAHFEKEVGIVAILDGAGDLDNEVRSFLSEFAQLTGKVHVTILQKGEDPAREQELKATILPTFALTDKEGHPLGVQFHGVPGGHEINSFILALYNAAGFGQSIDGKLLERINALDRVANIKVCVSLSCTFCPDVVVATQLMALRSPYIEAEMIDVARFPEFKKRWNIMSVPAIVIDDERIAFGKKSSEELLSLIENRGE